MNLIDLSVSVNKYSSESQKIRVLTETWVNRNTYCPNCLTPLKQYENNRPVADFLCCNCGEEFELKSKKNSLGKKIVDGAYDSMIRRINSSSNPNFYFLTYTQKTYKITNFLIIPKHFFINDIIEKRKPLSIKAKRAGWVGCNIILDKVPESGKIYYIKDGNSLTKKEVSINWKKTLFLQETKSLTNKGWLLDTLICLDKIKSTTFSLNEIYSFAPTLAIKHPNNKHINDKLRQQLQILRDREYIEFLGNGKYKKI